MSEEKKDMIKRAKRLIALIKAKEPPKNYVARRTSKVQGEVRDWNEGTTVKEYDDDAVRCTSSNSSLTILARTMRTSTSSAIMRTE
jgi:hypothetical protein